MTTTLLIIAGIIILLILPFVAKKLLWLIFPPKRPARELQKSGGVIDNYVLGEKAGKIKLPQELALFKIFHTPNSYIDNAAISGSGLFSFLLNTPSNAGKYYGPNHGAFTLCRFTRLSGNIADVSVFIKERRGVALPDAYILQSNDITFFNADTSRPLLAEGAPFLISNPQLDAKFVFFGNDGLKKLLNPELIFALAQNSSYDIIIKNNSLLLLNPYALPNKGLKPHHITGALEHYETAELLIKALNSAKPPVAAPPAF